MKTRLVVRALLLTVGMTALWAVAGRARAQEGPPPVCVPVGEEGEVCATPGQPIICPPQEEGFSSCLAPFTPEFPSWTLVFKPNNAIKISTVVNDSFVLETDLITTNQLAYAARTDFPGSVCVPTDPDG